MLPRLPNDLVVGSVEIFHLGRECYNGLGRGAARIVIDLRERVSPNLCQVSLALFILEAGIIGGGCWVLRGNSSMYFSSFYGRIGWM
jgi:hypothetical protein